MLEEPNKPDSLITIFFKVVFGMDYFIPTIRANRPFHGFRREFLYKI